MSRLALEQCWMCALSSRVLWGSVVLHPQKIGTVVRKPVMISALVELHFHKEVFFMKLGRL